MLNKIGEILFTGFIFACLVVLLLNFITTWLWNTIMAGALGLPYLTFWEVYGLSILIKILFTDININSEE